jgi:hypothetical protein
MFELKPLSRDAIPAALEKAMRYRLLNEPAEAESICRDVLEVEPGNEEALVALILALTDQFRERLGHAYGEAQGLIARLMDPYDRAYYSGILCERRAKAHLRQGQPDAIRIACAWLRQAMDHFEQAEPLRPQGNDDAILRWNTCARLLMKHPGVSIPEIEPESPLGLE